MKFISLTIGIVSLFLSGLSNAAVYAPKNYTCSMENDKCTCSQSETLTFPLKHVIEKQLCKDSGQTHYQFTHIYLYYTPQKFISAFYMNAENSNQPAFGIVSSTNQLVPYMGTENNWESGIGYYHCSAVDQPELCPMNIAPEMNIK
ncbi:hypothetical protein [Flavobacterium sp.]|uniref:hypothetical protein n=1 Tax=Flavobacterium sp. TaxID=239 RepID=UPI003F6A017D